MPIHPTLRMIQQAFHLLHDHQERRHAPIEGQAGGTFRPIQFDRAGGATIPLRQWFD
jgi:hypothetical protein